MTVNLSDIFVSTDRTLLDHQWIVQQVKAAYWGHWRSPALILKSVDNSLCFGLYWQDPTTGGATPVRHKQIGFARIVTDKATFSYLCDVVVAEEYRSMGFGKFLISQIMLHPDVAHTVSFLNTKDAHSLYQRFGYERHEVMRRIPKNK